MRSEFLWVFFARGCARAGECVVAEMEDERILPIECGKGGVDSRGEVLWSVWVASGAMLDAYVRRGGRESD